jgi:hypothetical protein
MQPVLGLTDEDAFMQSTLGRLSLWYATQCDGDWEHDSGVTIETLDNPGWRITIRLNGTVLENEPFDAYEDQFSHSEEWLRCWRENLTFHAACAPKRLEDAILIFLAWAKV